MNEIHRTVTIAAAAPVKLLSWHFLSLVWFSHQEWNPIHDHHVLSHHHVYPDSSHCLSTKFRLAEGKYDSSKALLPWFVLAAMLEFAVLPRCLPVPAQSSWPLWLACSRGFICSFT